MMGMVHIYTGDGKGKTTAAVGLCTRAAGHGKKAAFYEFLKGAKTGEAKSLAALGVEFSPGRGQKRKKRNAAPARRTRLPVRRHTWRSMTLWYWTRCCAR